MVAVAEPQGQQSFYLTKLDVNGQPYTVPNAGGFVYMYEPGSTVPRTTWVDSAQTTANTDPIQLDPHGRCIIYGTGQYRQVVTDALGSVEWDQLTELGIDNTFITNTLLSFSVTIDGPNPNPPISNPTQGSRSIAEVLGSFVDARNFGALRQGSDDLAIIQLAINYAGAIGGATVYLGPGPLNTVSSSQLVWPSNGNGVCLKGDGPANTVFNVAGSMHQDLFVLTAGNLMHCQIRDIGFLCGGTPSNGALINFTNNYSADVDNVRMDGEFFNGIAIHGGPNQYLCTIRDLVCKAASSSNACIVVGDDLSGPVVGIYIDTCKLTASAFGIYLRNTSGMSISDTECFDHVQSGLITSPAASEVAKSVTVSNLISYNCGGAAINIGNSGGTVVAVSIMGGSANSSQNGIIISPNPNANNVSIVGTQIINNQQSGIINFGANAVEISDCMLAGNGTATLNTYDQIVIQGGALLNGVDGNVIGAATGFPAVHRHAISLLDPCDYCTIIGNKTGGPSLSGVPINNASSGTHNVVTNNVGT